MNIKNSISNKTQLTPQEIEEVKFKTALECHRQELSSSMIIQGNSLINAPIKATNCKGLLKIAKQQDTQLKAKVKETMNLVELIINGESKSIDARTLDQKIDNIAPHACFELAFIVGLVKIFEKSDRGTQQSLLNVKKTILERYSNQASDIQTLLSEHKKALEAIVQPTSYAKYATVFAFLTLLIAFFAIKMA
jgi:hypothetical protein